MEWSIQHIAKLAGTTSRTLRHYGEEGLLVPARTGANGYRYYDEDNLVTLQRILLLRELGLGLDDIRHVLARDVSEEQALTTHLDYLQHEQDRIGRQINAVRTTISARRQGEKLMAENALDGFDYTEYQEEVQQRWGKQAADQSAAWWNGLSVTEKSTWQEKTAALGAAWGAAAASGIDPEGEEAQALAARHVAWLRSIPGTPAANGGHIAGYVKGLGDMYVADPRFAANYGGQEGATFVRAALHAFIDAQ